MKFLVIPFLGILILGMSANADEQLCTGVPLPLTSTDQIIEAVVCQTGGNVLKLEESNSLDGQYQVRILLPDGRIRNYLVDGASGNLIIDEESR